MIKLANIFLVTLCLIACSWALGCGGDEKSKSKASSESSLESLGGPAEQAVAVFNKGCECKRLRKEGDEEGAKSCAKKLAASQGELKQRLKNLAPEERRKVAEAITGLKCEASSSTVKGSKNPLGDGSKLVARLESLSEKACACERVECLAAVKAQFMVIRGQLKDRYPRKSDVPKNILEAAQKADKRGRKCERELKAKQK